MTIRRIAVVGPRQDKLEEEKLFSTHLWIRNRVDFFNNRMLVVGLIPISDAGLFTAEFCYRKKIPFEVFTTEEDLSEFREEETRRRYKQTVKRAKKITTVADGSCRGVNCANRNASLVTWLSELSGILLAIHDGKSHGNVLECLRQAERSNLRIERLVPSEIKTWRGP